MQSVGYKLLGGTIGILSVIASSCLLAQQPTVAAQTGMGVPADELLAKRVTIHLENVSLTRAIDSVSRVSKVFVQYQVPQLEEYPAPITLNVTDMPLGIVLEQLLSKTALRVVSGRQGSLRIVMSRENLTDSVPGVGTVSGRIIDSTTGRGLSGAVIKIAGTKLSALSTDSGRFVFHTVPIGDQILTAKLFSYRATERSITVAAGAPISIRILMTAVPNVLSGVVTTATGVQRKVEVGSDITTLNVDSVMRVAPIASVTDLLETRVPGLTVMHSSGAPGDPSRLRLRGTRSAQLSNDPILIVDGIRMYSNQSDPRNQNLAPSLLANGAQGGGRGVYAYNAPSPLDQIDPNSIETIEVVKGPAASATYGSDAASGVIVITTKKGRAGPAIWNANVQDGVSWLPGTWPTNYYRFGNVPGGNYSGYNYPFCPWYVVGCQVDSVVPFQALNDPRYTVLTHGSDQSATLGISGGQGVLTYRLTGSTRSSMGNLKLPASEIQRYDSLYGQISSALVRPDRWNTWSVDGSLVVAPQQNLNAALTSSLFSSDQRKSSLEGVVGQLAGLYLSPLFLQGPLIQGEYERASDDRLTANNALSFQWRPRPWLPLEGTAGISTEQRNDVAYVPFGVYDEVYHGFVPDNPADTTGWYGIGRGNTRTTTATLMTGIPMFGGRITASVGGSFVSGSTADFQDYTKYLQPGVLSPSQFLDRCTDGSIECGTIATQRTTAQSTYGWFVEPHLNVSSRFFVTPSFRMDGGSGGTKSASSLGGLNSFPGMDFSFLAIDPQNNRPLWGVISLLRPKLSLGIAGTQPAPADKLRLYNVGSFKLTPTQAGSGYLTGTQQDVGCNPQATLDGVTPVQAVCINALGNTQLRPERSGDVEGGFDTELWHGRVTLTVTHHNGLTRDEIINVPVAQSVFSNGASQFLIQENVGAVRNTGTEITMTVAPLETRAVSWSMDGNFSQNRNRVVRLNAGQSSIVINNTDGVLGIQQRIQPGYPLFAEFVTPILGYADANGDGIIDASEVRYGDSLVYAGEPEPNYQLNVSNHLTLFNGRLSVHAAVSYEKGLTQYNQGLCGTSNSPFQLLPNTPNTPLATQAAVAAAGCITGEHPQQSPIGLIQMVNTLRFQSMSVNYVVPKRIASWMHAPTMSMALQGSNLGLHTNYRGKDPNVNAFATVSAGDQTVDTGQIPEPRKFILSISVGN